MYMKFSPIKTLKQELEAFEQSSDQFLTQIQLIYDNVYVEMRKSNGETNIISKLHIKIFDDNMCLYSIARIYTGPFFMNTTELEFCNIIIGTVSLENIKNICNLYMTKGKGSNYCGQFMENLLVEN